MRPTQFFARKSDMTAFAKAFTKAGENHWYLHSSLRCLHDVIHNRKAIVLVDNEQIVQRIICCNVCAQAIDKVASVKQFNDAVEKHIVDCRNADFKHLLNVIENVIKLKSGKHVH